MTFSYLITQEKLESHSNSQSWIYKAKNDFYMRLTNKQFPCLFALNAFCNKGILFLFIDDKQSLLLNGLMEYISFVKNTPIKNRLTNPLVIFFKQKFDTLEKEHVFAWKQIQFLHDNDTQPYPSHIPLDTDSPQWCFCFQDIELFINVSCPHHDMYKNRNLGAYIAFVINPRENFDFVASGSKKSGIRVRERIRERVKDYNNGIIPKELGFFGDEDNREWRQYTLQEEREIFKVCPFRFSAKKGLR